MAGNDTNTMTQVLIRKFTDSYMETLFYFCLKKTGNSTDAEDLTQDIALQILSALTHGTIPTSFSAWVWQIARNRYAVWANGKHQSAEAVTGSDIGDCEIEDEGESVPDTLIHAEQLSLLRRELAFIKNEYRSLLVAYYMEQKRLREIADALHLSENAVKKRLCRARKILKEGMDMARTFGVRSYRPEEITYTNNCKHPGKKNQPYSIFEHKLYQNIFLEAYGNPSDAETLSLELGIALPYMEDELEYLTRETLLAKQGQTYQTAFPMISRTAQEQVHLAQLTAAPDITNALTRFVDGLHDACLVHGYAYYGTYQDYESAKWTLLMLAYDHFFGTVYHSNAQIAPSARTARAHTARPDGGMWDLIGYQCCGVTEPNFVGNHGSGSGFQQFRYEFDGIADRTPPFLTEEEARVLRSYVTKTESQTERETASRLYTYGYLNKDGDSYTPNILVFSTDEIKERIRSFDSDTIKTLTALAEDAACQMETLYHTVADSIRSDLPELFREDDYQCGLAIDNCCFARGYIMAEALRKGYLLPADKVNAAIGAHMYL